MSIPNNITTENLISAIAKIDDEGIPSEGNSQYYDVLYNNKRYPPKLIVSYANLFANGEILDRKSFEGGLDTPAFKLLEDSGFQITKKNENDSISFYDDLNKFLDQARKGQLGTASYLKEYLNLKVKVSFGQGYPARIPWIAFLREGQTVQNGIYPVYLFYKDEELLILAYCISETKKPINSWNLSNTKTIEEYFGENNLGIPQRYGKSFVFKTYNTSKALVKDEIESDLSKIADTYKKLALMSEEPNSKINKDIDGHSSYEKRSEPMKQQFNYLEFCERLLNVNFYITETLCLRFIASLLTKPFVILTGLSGSGKTKLAQAFAMWICQSEKQLCIVPVGADWTNREPLLGFPNALKSGEYIKPDNGVLDLIIAASNDSAKPYFLILDEMNLSHVERYFADFLSVMETNGKIYLHTGDETWNDIPSDINLPKNLFIIGTVNIDETTYMFSPKVLDRANVIEFRVSASEMANYLNNSDPLDLDSIEFAGASMAENFVEIATAPNIEPRDPQTLYNTLLIFFTELKKVGAEFGYRSAAEILRFASVVNKIEAEYSISEIIDSAIMQKLLPKVHGSRRKLEPVLKMLGKFCIANEQDLDEYSSQKPESTFAENVKIKYPISFEKIMRMDQGLKNNGFTSYAEA